MTELEMFRLHVGNSMRTSYADLFNELVDLLEQSLRALDEDDFPALRQRIREVLSK